MARQKKCAPSCESVRVIPFACLAEKTPNEALLALAVTCSVDL